jgi:hypothetical protein
MHFNYKMMFDDEEKKEDVPIRNDQDEMESEYETVPMSEDVEDWKLADEENYEDPIMDWNWTIFDHYAQSKSQGRDNDRFIKLVNLMDENYGQVSMYRLCQMVQKWYNEELRDFTVEEGTEIRNTEQAMSLIAIRKYIEKAKSPPFINQTITDIDFELLQIIRDNGLFERLKSDPSKRRYNPKILKDYVIIRKHCIENNKMRSETRNKSLIGLCSK